MTKRLLSLLGGTLLSAMFLVGCGVDTNNNNPAPPTNVPTPKDLNNDNVPSPNKDALDDTNKNGIINPNK